ncbi:hypothetical protein [Acidocella sp.]|uniref:hypothetical protein n=1 Tax=Acidocella sp. TaxID=50710 RepID=UPI0026214C38|nr:hypothetical protein [Acidocella sp.]
MPPLRTTLLACLTLSLGATPALARSYLTPPPSGQVIHLFGPGSVLNQLPGLGTNAPAAAPGVAATPSPATMGGAEPGNAASSPTLHDVLHQMFVTGDPNATPGQSFAKGRQNTP